MPDTHEKANGPRRLGDFEIVREVGRGGMGVVFEARQISLNRKVALKVLASTLGLTARAVERFQREAEAAAKLHHTNIVPVYATGEQDGAHFYAMELIAGPSLDQVIKQMRHPSQAAASPDLAATGPYVENAGSSNSTPGLRSSSIQSGSAYFDTVARLMAEVADALDYAHKQGVVHRDVKPSNLLVSPQGRLSLNDFGLARMLEQPGMTMTGEFVGTPAYMSPEQITAGRIPLDHRTDIYSLGATLYEMLTLQTPFTGDRRDQVLAQIIQKDPTPPRKLNRNVPRDLETICLKALDKDPDKRYQTAGQMAEDLRRFVNRFAISAKRAGPVERLRKWVRRHPALTAALVLVVVVTAAAGVLAYQTYRAEQEHSAERQRLEEQVLAEKRQVALDRAALAARLCEFDEAEKAILEAERLGASAGQVRMLYGQVALYSGKYDEGVKHLEQAAALLPDSVAARALLASAYLGESWTAFQKTLNEARALTPQTADDYYFLAGAESAVDLEKGLRLMQEAVRRHPSPMVHLDRADNLSNLALDKGDPTYGEEAIQEVERVVRDDLPDSPFALMELMYAYFTTSNAYMLVGKPEKSREMLARATPCFQKVGKDRFPGDNYAGQVRFFFYQLSGDDNQVLAELQRNAEKPIWSFLYAINLYRRGQTQEALAANEKHPGLGPNDPFRCLLLAEVDGGTDRALALCREVAKRDLQGHDFLFCQSILRMLGDKDESIRACQKLTAQPDRFRALEIVVVQRSVEYLAGQLDEKQLLEAVKGSLYAQSNAHFVIAVAKLSEGRRAEAHEHFRRSAATRALGPFNYHYQISNAILPHIAEDPKWPKWAPSAK